MLFRTPARAALRWQQRRRGGVTVLKYHGFGDPQFMDPNLFVGAGRFRKPVAYLAAHYRPVPVDEACAHLATGKTLPPGGVALTTDDGFRNVYELAAPVLRDHGWPATVFVSTGPLDTRTSLWPTTVHYWFATTPAEALCVSLPTGGAEGAVDGSKEYVFRLDTPSQRTKARRVVLAAIQGLEPRLREAALARLAGALGVPPGADPFPPMPMLSWDETRWLARHGVAIGGHTVSHPSLATLSPGEARAEIAGCRKRLGDELGTPVTTFAYPFGMARDWNEAVRYGLIDKVLEKRGELPAQGSAKPA